MLIPVCWVNAADDMTTRSWKMAASWLKAGTQVEVWVAGRMVKVLEPNAISVAVAR